NLLIDALAWVERLNPLDSGLLSFSEAHGGGIFAENRRICWVAAQGLQHRLRDLLRDRSILSELEIERFYQRCHSEGRPFGQTLVKEGLIEPPELERVLRRHSAESLIKLCRVPQTLEWSSRGGRGYAPQFTFPALDVLFDAVEVLLPE